MLPSHPAATKHPISVVVTGAGGDLAANGGAVLFHQEFLPKADQVRREGEAEKKGEGDGRDG